MFFPFLYYGRNSVTENEIIIHLSVQTPKAIALPFLPFWHASRQRQRRNPFRMMNEWCLDELLEMWYFLIEFSAVENVSFSPIQLAFRHATPSGGSSAHQQHEIHIIITFEINSIKNRPRNCVNKQLIMKFFLSLAIYLNNFHFLVWKYHQNADIIQFWAMKNKKRNIYVLIIVWGEDVDICYKIHFFQIFSRFSWILAKWPNRRNGFPSHVNRMSVCRNVCVLYCITFLMLCAKRLGKIVTIFIRYFSIMNFKITKSEIFLRLWSNYMNLLCFSELRGPTPHWLYPIFFIHNEISQRCFMKLSCENVN